MTRVLAVVPARNERGRVGPAVRALAALASEVVVVDDASTDGTAREAEEAGARVVSLPARRGKGGALAAGIAAAQPAGDDVLLFADADLSSAAAGLGVLVAEVAAGRADVAIAAPPREAPSGFGLVEGFARWGIRRLTGRELSRPLSGQRAVRAGVLAGADLGSGFGVETALTIDALRAGYRVVEVPVEFTHARTGRTVAGFVHRARQGRDVAAALASRWRAGSRAGVRR